MSFKKDRYQVIKNVISKEISEVAFNYLKIRETAERKLNYYNIKTKWFGDFDDPQVPGAYSIYGDYLMETLLIKTLPFIEKKTSLKLVPTYAYTRLYKTGHVLNRHKDRESCEISTTMNLGGDEWPIYLEPSGKQSMKGIKVDLKPGDMLVYPGCELEHWREKFTGKECIQVFLHYNNRKTPGAKDNMFDKRPHLGLPAFFKKNQ